VPVPAGTTSNVLAEPPGFDPTEAHLLLGAHLDTVPQSPGAEDNASGVAVLLEIARLRASAPAGLPVVVVAFAAEEPRGAGDNSHHFGSRAYVAAMPTRVRRALVAMVSLDRVGVGRTVPVCTGGRGPSEPARWVLAQARRLHIPARRCANRASDHWSFERAGLPAVRVGSTPYDAYHSVRDRPEVVQRAQLDRVGRLVAATLTTLPRP
jgi:Zn-dependent M28 family amino/carboxypeptidase